MNGLVAGIGRFSLETVRFFGSLTFLSIRAFAGVVGKRRRVEEVFRYIVQIAIDSFPLVGIISAFIGMVMVMETVYTLKRFGAESYAGGLVGISMARELGPVILAFIIAGRVGAAIAAELGTMKITEQIDVLEVLAVDPVKYLVSPRLLAAVIGVPCLFLLSLFLAVAGGFVVGVTIVGIGSGMYIQQTFEFVAMKDIFVGFVKTVVFAAIVILTSAHEGLHARGGAEGVGRAATTAVVISFFLIIFANLVLTAFFYFF